jgi:lambda family phage tail tape measure protein
LARFLPYLALNTRIVAGHSYYPRKGQVMTAVKDNVKETIDTYADKAKGATNAAASVVDRAKQTVSGMAASVADYAGDAKDKVKDLAVEVGESAKVASDKVQKWAGDAYDVTSHAAGDFGREVTSMVKKYPIPSLLVGFGLGLIVGRSIRS